MKHRTHTIVAATLCLIMNSEVMASQVTIPNTFTAGTAAVASEVNANFTELETGVDDNDTRITTNATNITTNAGNITSNTSAIAALEARIAALESPGGGTGLSVSDISGDYVVVGMDVQLQIGQVEHDLDQYWLPAEILNSTVFTFTFDGAGGFTGTHTVNEKIERRQGHKIVDPDGVSGSGDEYGATNATLTITDESGTSFSGTYSVSGSVITLTNGASTETLYATANGQMFVWQDVYSDNGTFPTWESQSGAIRVGVKIWQ